MPVTTNGTPYTVTSYTVADAGTVVIGIPDGKIGQPGLTFFLYGHGAGGPANQFASLGAWAPMRDAMIDAGIGWAEGTMGGAQPWCNPASEIAAGATQDHADSLHDIAHWVFLGRSMNGSLMARFYNARRATDSRVVGLIVNSGVQDLVWAYDWDDNRWTAAFNSAWGVTSKAEFVAAVAGLNPIDGPASQWDGANVLQLWGDADDLVIPEDNALAMRAMYAGRPAVDAYDVRLGGDHSSTNGSYFQVAAMMNFLAEVTGGTPTPTPPAVYYLATAMLLKVPGGFREVIV